jgi:hypothetical protein
LVEFSNMMADVNIGYPVSTNSLKKMWSIIHERHFVNFEKDMPIIFNILEYYEYN